MVTRCGILLAVLLGALSPLQAAPLWLAVAHTTKRTGATYYPEIVKTQAEQTTLGKAEGGRVGYGYSGPRNLYTRRLQFTCRDKTYAVPDPFVDDLLWLGVDSSVRASLNGKDAVFTMIGSSGEKGYSVHFHFRNDRFSQRILSDTEFQIIHIRTNAASPPP